MLDVIYAFVMSTHTVAGGYKACRETGIPGLRLVRQCAEKMTVLALVQMMTKIPGSFKKNGEKMKKKTN